MLEKERDIISNLRAIIISCKGGLPLVNVQNDYLEAFGEKVPIRELGYTSLRDLFEKNSSDFYIFGDKVDIVVKSASAHIKSLVCRQRDRTKSRKSSKNTGNTRHPKKKEGVSYDVPPRSTRENNYKHPREYSKYQSKMDSVERITLRKPKASGMPELMQPSSFPGTLQKIPSSLSENVKNLSSTLKTVMDDGTVKPKKSPTVIDGNKTVAYTELFENIEDLPVCSSAQSRLLRQKLQNSESQKAKVLEDFKSMNIKENSTDGTNPQEVKRIFVDVQSLSSSIHAAPSPRPNECYTPKLSVDYSHQKAQARIAQIKHSMQSFIQNTASLQNEVNNNKMENLNLKFEKSPNDKLGLERSFTRSDTESKADSASLTKSLGSLEKYENERTQISPLEISGEYTDSAVSSQDKQTVKNQDTLYVTKLKELCKLRGFLDPSYKIIVSEPRDEPKHFICKVQIEDYLQISSYPIETQDPFYAKEIAAKKMYNYCISDGTFRKKNTENEEVLISRILEIASTTYGIWSDKLPILYRNYFKEEISEDWFNIITKTSSFAIDNYDGERFIVRKKIECSTPEPGAVKSSKGTNNEGSVLQSLPELEIPDSAHWEIYITNVSNSAEIWCRLIGEKYSDAYDTMMTKLELEPPERKAVKPKVGGFYSTKVSAIWYRVKLIESISESQGLAFYIDIGDKDIVSLSDLYEPEGLYFSVAPQAVMLSLFELAPFSNDEELTSFITNNLLGNTYIGEIVTKTVDCEKNRKTVRLWDTSTERDINVNQILLNNIIKNIRTPTLPNTAQIKEVLVSSVSENGDIHVQTSEKSVNRLKCLILNKIKSLEAVTVKRETNDTIGTDILYLTKYKRNDTFCRAKVTEIQNLNMVDVLFVDYGLIERIAVSELIHLEKSSILQAIPAQAIKVRLGNITFFSRNVVTKLREIILNENVLMKVLSLGSGSLPSVEFFKRSSIGNTLYSVNMKITNDPEARDITVPARRKSVVVGLENVLPRNLPAPAIPEIGQHFEVFVTLASSPDLFIVQPLSTRSDFMRMMNKLQELFSENRVSMTPANDFVVGELYAVLHPDGNWYRGCAQAVVGSCNYSVYMCDFGDCIMITKDKLMVLPEEFKTFPYQAIRATLLGIPPEFRDWAPIDCVNFHKLVVEKYFVSTVMDINRDKRNPNYVNLGLILTDTSGEEDVYIHKVLLDKKNEVYTLINN